MSAAITAAFEFLGVRGIIGVAVALALSVALGLQVHKTHEAQASATKWENSYNGDHAAFLQTIINYGGALKKAQAEAAQNLARVEQQDAAQGRKTQASYEKRLADARALAERLRLEDTGSSAHPGSANQAHVPGVSSAPGGPVAGPAKDQLSRNDKLTATEQAIQLDELIKWVEGIHVVDVNGAQK